MSTVVDLYFSYAWEYGSMISFYPHFFTLSTEESSPTNSKDESLVKLFHLTKETSSNFIVTMSVGLRRGLVPKIFLDFGLYRGLVWVVAILYDYSRYSLRRGRDKAKL